MQQYETITESLADLKERGYTYNFNLHSNSLRCEELNLSLHPDQFTIAEYYRFEGPTDPADNSIIYAIESDKGVKGVLVDAYGVYADTLSTEMITKLKTASV